MDYKKQMRKKYKILKVKFRLIFELVIYNNDFISGV